MCAIFRKGIVVVLDHPINKLGKAFIKDFVELFYQFFETSYPNTAITCFGNNKQTSSLGGQFIAVLS